MSEQTSIPKHKLTRAASLLKTGVKIGGNYAKYYGRKVTTGVDDRDQLHQDNAEDAYQAFSELKGSPLKVAQMLSMDQNILPRGVSGAVCPSSLLRTTIVLPTGGPNFS